MGRLGWWGRVGVVVSLRAIAYAFAVRRLAAFLCLCVAHTACSDDGEAPAGSTGQQVGSSSDDSSSNGASGGDSSSGDSDAASDGAESSGGSTGLPDAEPLACEWGDSPNGGMREVLCEEPARTLTCAAEWTACQANVLCAEEYLCLLDCTGEVDSGGCMSDCWDATSGDEDTAQLETELLMCVSDACCHCFEEIGIDAC